MGKPVKSNVDRESALETARYAAQVLTNDALADRLFALKASRRAFAKHQADAYLHEAAVRLTEWESES